MRHCNVTFGVVQYELGRMHEVPQRKPVNLLDPSVTWKSLKKTKQTTPTFDIVTDADERGQVRRIQCDIQCNIHFAR